MPPTLDIKEAVAKWNEPAGVSVNEEEITHLLWSFDGSGMLYLVGPEKA